LRVLDLLGQLRELGRNSLLRQDGIGHLDGLFVVRDHRLGELHVGKVDEAEPAAVKPESLEQPVTRIIRPRSAAPAQPPSL
jgi:hypothetical protein